MLEDCRIYVCKSTFGNQDNECLKFKDYIEYLEWMKKGNDINNTVFSPVCNCSKKLDKLILMMRSKKFCNLKIKEMEN